MLNQTVTVHSHINGGGFSAQTAHTQYMTYGAAYCNLFLVHDDAEVVLASPPLAAEHAGGGRRALNTRQYQQTVSTRKPQC